METNKESVQIGFVNIPAIVVVLFASCMIALEYGFNYGLWNHNTYLLQGFHWFKPDLLTNDWLTTETTYYHPFFSWIVYGLYMITPNGWSFAIANFIFIILSVFYIYKIIEITCKNSQPLFIFMLVASIIAAAEAFSIGGSYIFSRIFQPSTIASLTFLIGFYYFLKNRYLTSGIFFAVGGLFHVNFLILGIPLYGMFHLYQRDKQFIKNTAVQILPSLIALSFHLPLIIASALSPDAAEGRRIFQEVHAPQHYVPMTYLREFLPFYGWHIIAFVIGWKYINSDNLVSKFKILFFIQLIFISIASLLTTVVFIPSVSQLFVWRLAPFSVLFAQIIISYGIVKKLSAPYQNKFDLKHILLFFIYGGCIYFIWNNHYGWFKTVTIRTILFVGLAVVIAGFLKKCYSLTDKKRLTFQTTIVLIAFLYATTMPLSDFFERANLITGLPKSEVELFKWVGENTPEDALFIIPPEFRDFRLNAERAIITDSKSTPVVASELVEWYHRIEDVINYPNVPSQKDIDYYYNRHTNQSLLNVYTKYGCDYAVIHADYFKNQFVDFKVLYSNKKYKVLQKI